MTNANQPALDARTETARQYETYYKTGYYDRRYPQANAHVLALLNRHLPEGGRFLDFGCGSGRYLMRMAERSSAAIGFDICNTALVRLREKEDQAPSGASIRICGPDHEDLEAEIDKSGTVDLAVCLFGVLSHINTNMDRRAVLERLCRAVKPDTGKVIVSVPNRFRRFYREQLFQKAGHTGDIFYTRLFAEGKVDFSYKLFDPASFVQELEQAGLVVEHLAAESLFPESWNSRSAACRAVERFIAPKLPVFAGYGMIAVARPR